MLQSLPICGLCGEGTQQGPVAPCAWTGRQGGNDGIAPGSVFQTCMHALPQKFWAQQTTEHL